MQLNESGPLMTPQSGHSSPCHSSSSSSSSPPPRAAEASERSSSFSSRTEDSDAKRELHHHKEPSNTTSRKNEKGKAMSRRGHFKSRLGCFNCKRRRVKCNEQRPICSPCNRLGLVCSYPTTVASSSNNPRPTPSVLSLQDLRFYHQFLTVAFPTLPLKATDVWMQAGAMSHSYDYLAHAVLGLGASHISQHGHVDFSEQALQHRVTAIKLVNEQLDKPPEKSADTDALFATLICLIAQSSLMPDSMVEYLTMTRGANLVATTMISDYHSSIFQCFTAQGHIEALTRLATEQPRDFAIVDGFEASVMLLRELCQTPFEFSYWESLLKCISASRTSSVAAWKVFVIVFILPSTFSNDDFLAFIDAGNYIGHILVIHGFLLDYILGRFILPPSEQPKYPARKNVVISWTRGLAKKLPPEMKIYMQWALQFCDILEVQDARYLLSP